MSWKPKQRVFADLKKRKTSYAPKTDIEDGTKPHELDPDYIVQALEEEKIDREEYGILPEDSPERQAKEALASPLVPFESEDPRLHRIDQLAVDKVRMRVLPFSILRAINKKMIGPENKPPIRHFWFPEDDDRNYQLKMGNPPPDSQRPAHLRGLKLEQDLGIITPEVAMAFMNRLQQAMQDDEEDRLIVVPTLGGIYG
jgi:hypothetical protein